MKWRTIKGLAGCAIIMLSLGNESVMIGQMRQNRQPSTARLDANKPTLYLTFKGVVLAGVKTGLEEEQLRIELHNNTRWTISCYLVNGPTAPGDSSIMYQVDTTNGSQPIHHATDDVLIPKAVESGKSVSFLVSPGHLRKGYRIYVEFNYDWEKRGQIAPYGVEPSHRVYFYHNDLPENLRSRD